MSEILNSHTWEGGFESPPGQYPLEKRESVSKALGMAYRYIFQVSDHCLKKKKKSLFVLVSKPDDNAVGTLRA